MASMRFLLVLVAFFAILFHLEARPSGQDETCHEPTDMLFIVDSSSSIWPKYFNENVKKFVKDIISSFDIGPGPKETRVGLLLFGSREYLEFHLNDYHTTDALLDAVDSMRFRGGDTYTHRALEFAVKVMLTPENGARDDVKKVAVILTDGKSRNAKKTLAGATALKDLGVQVFAVGVGYAVDYVELHDMASSPSNKFVYQVTDFRALDSIKQSFTRSTCNVLKTTAPPTTTTTTTTTTTPTTTTTTPSTTTTTPTTTTTTPTTTTTTPTTTTTTPTTTTTTPTTTTSTTTTTTTPTTTTTMPTTTTITSTTTTTTPTTTTTSTAPTTAWKPQGDRPFNQLCKGKPADIYFLLDASTSVWIHHFNDRVLPFVRDLASSFQISPLHTRIGLVTFSNDVNHEFGLAEHTTLKELLSAIQPEEVEYLTGGTNTGDAIQYVVDRGFKSGEARPDVAQIIITVTDGLSQLPEKTAQAAANARAHGIYMFAVGVGKHLDEKELADIASNPDEDFVFSVEDFQALASITELLAIKACDAVSDGKPPADHTACSTLPSNVMFVYEYLNSFSASKMILEELIGHFISVSARVAPHIQVGVMTQPCVGGATGMMSVDSFQQIWSQIHSGYYVTYPQLVRQLRIETFQNIPRTEERVAVLVVDETTQNLEQLQTEIQRLKFKNVKVIVVAVGKVEETVLEKLASKPTKNHVIRLDSYLDMREKKVDLLSLLCSIDALPATSLFSPVESTSQPDRVNNHRTTQNDVPVVQTTDIVLDVIPN